MKGISEKEQHCALWEITALRYGTSQNKRETGRPPAAAQCPAGNDSLVFCLQVSWLRERYEKDLVHHLLPFFPYEMHQPAARRHDKPGKQKPTPAPQVKTRALISIEAAWPIFETRPAILGRARSVVSVFLAAVVVFVVAEDPLWTLSSQLPSQNIAPCICCGLARTSR